MTRRGTRCCYGLLWRYSDNGNPAVDFLRQHLPDIKIRVINVVDLMVLQPPSEHPHGISDKDYEGIFT